MFLASALILATAPFGHDYVISSDGAWCWFADPRAIWYRGNIAAGSVSSTGDINVDIFNPKDNSSSTYTIAPKFEKDDHDNPALIELPNGQIAAFYSKHTGPDLYMTVGTTMNESIDWTESKKINPNDPNYTGPKGAINSYTYPNPQLLSQEKNRLFLFWRGMNWKPTFSFSDDLGKTWSTGKILVSPKSEDSYNRPYTKISGDGKSQINIAFTDGHPRNEPTNSIYFLKYEKGNFRSATNDQIATIKQLPIEPQKADVVYDGKVENMRSWIWDVAQTKNGNPVIAYSRMPKETEHYYRYVWHNGKRWIDRPIVFGGKWFPQTPEGKTEQEPHYSGGVVIDHNDPRFVYLSRPINGKFEIERWFTPDGGDSWSHVAITGNSKHDSVRPFGIRGEKPSEQSPNVLWMNFTKYIHYTNFTSTIQAAKEDFRPFPANDPMRSADAVFRWVRSNPSPYPVYEWMIAPLLSGVLEYGETTQNQEAIDWVRQQGQKINYSMGPRKAMADDVAVAQAFLRLYQLDKNPAQLQPAKTWIDGFVAMPHTRSLEWKDNVYQEEMAWCDSLYMAPPAMAQLSAITGDQSYVDKMSKLWWKTSDYLYDPAENLYFRDSRYFNQKEANGNKVFWSRGNGWVLAGLARVLQHLPSNHPDRPKFIKQFQEMSMTLAMLQTQDGTWHASLLDPDSYPTPETSGTGFFIYAMAWGVNNGILERESFEVTINRGFKALSDAIDPSGRVSWIQPVGADPKSVKASDTDTYGVGAFLLAACELKKFQSKK